MSVIRIMSLLYLIKMKLNNLKDPNSIRATLRIVQITEDYINKKTSIMGVNKEFVKFYINSRKKLKNTEKA